MTVKEIVTKYLKENGYDGLCHAECECACELGELMPCDEPCEECEPGYKVPCDCGDHDFHIVPEKEQK